MTEEKLKWETLKIETYSICEKNYKTSTYNELFEMICEIHFKVFPPSTRLNYDMGTKREAKRCFNKWIKLNPTKIITN